VFERATTQAVRRWRFQAHRVDGNPVAIRARQRVDFLLDK
jgi:outer membrane biosynthesis protein TonB